MITVFALKFVTLCAAKQLSFKAIRARKKRTDAGDNYLDFWGKTLESSVTVSSYPCSHSEANTKLDYFLPDVSNI